MTPAIRKKKLEPVELTASNGRTVKVDRTSDTNVRVTWTCGGTRDFTPEGLRNAIANLETVAGYGDGVPLWMEDQDHARAKFAVRLHDGRLHADDHPSEGAHSVPWTTFKRALVARSK